MVDSSREEMISLGMKMVFTATEATGYTQLHCDHGGQDHGSR